MFNESAHHRPPFNVPVGAKRKRGPRKKKVVEQGLQEILNMQQARFPSSPLTTTISGIHSAGFIWDRLQDTGHLVQDKGHPYETIRYAMGQGQGTHE